MKRKARPSEPRYVLKGAVGATSYLGGCEFCGSEMPVGSCLVLYCRACASPLCIGGVKNHRCYICLHGVTKDSFECGFRGCGASAVAAAPNFKFLCAEHLSHGRAIMATKDTPGFLSLDRAIIALKARHLPKFELRPAPEQPPA